MIRSLIADQAFLAWLDVSTPVRVHSVFERSINLVVDDELWTLAAASLPVGPRTAVLDVSNVAALKATPAKPLRLTAIDWRDVARWHAPAAPQSVPDASVALLADLVAGRQRVSSNGFDAAIHERTCEIKSGLRALLRAGDEATAAVVAGSLVGLGPGLTPAGDDFLAGLAFGAASMQADSLVSALAKTIETSHEFTNPISLTMLREAVQGRATSPLHELLGALGAGQPREIKDAAERVFAIGHTSGEELVGGLLAALEYNERGN